MSVNLCTLSSDLLYEILMWLDNRLGYDRNVVNMCLICKSIYLEISKINNYWREKINRAFIPSCFDENNKKLLNDLQNENMLMRVYFNLEYLCSHHQKIPNPVLEKIQNFDSKELSISSLGTSCEKFYNGPGFGIWFQDGYYNHEYIYRKGRYQYYGAPFFAVNHKVPCIFYSNEIYTGDEYSTLNYHGFVWSVSLWELTQWCDIERNISSINYFYEGKERVIDQPEKPFFICLNCKRLDREKYENIVETLNNFIKHRGMKVSRLMYCNLLSEEPKFVMESLLSRTSKSFFSELLSYFHSELIPEIPTPRKKKCLLM